MSSLPCGSKARIEHFYFRRLRSSITSILLGDRRWMISSTRGNLCKQGHSMLKARTSTHAYTKSSQARKIAIHSFVSHADQVVCPSRLPKAARRYGHTHLGHRLQLDHGACCGQCLLRLTERHQFSLQSWRSNLLCDSVGSFRQCIRSSSIF